MHWSSIGIGLVIGIPLWALTYWWTRRRTAQGYGVGRSDYFPGESHHAGGDSGGSGSGD